jgi:lysophospholipase L1-like esterase
MRRAFPWLLSIALLIAFVASFSELQRMRGRFGEVTRHAFQDHAEVRLAVIRSAMAQHADPIVIFGDSLAEMAQFPGQVCGKPVVNAGVGGARLEELTALAGEVKGASLVVVLAGTNDAGSATIEADYLRFLSKLPSSVAIPATAFPAVNNQIVAASKRANVSVLDIGFSEFNGIHPTPAAYREWTDKMIAALSGECAR